MRTSRTIAVVAAAMLAASGIAACGGSSTSSTGGSAGSSSGVLNIGMPNGAQSDNNNPFLSSSAANSLGYKNVIYEPLVMTNVVQPSAAGTPWLATAWTWSNNYQKLVLTIRNGVTWSDGQPLTAADVAYTFNLLKANTTLNANAIKFGTIASSGNTVTLTFASSQYVYQTQILNQFIVPEHIWSKISNPATNAITNPVGTGPYTLTTFAGNTATLTRRATYWQKLPAVKTLHYTSYSSNTTQTTALTDGTADWSFVFIPNPSVTYTAKDPSNLKLWFPAVLGDHGLWLNTTIAPFNNANLRIAINDVINRQSIVTTGEDGYFYPVVNSNTGIPTPAGTSFIGSQFTGSTQSVSATTAKQLLTSSGFTYSGSKLEYQGKPVTLALSDPAGWSDYDTDLTLIQNDLATIGITATVSQPNANTWTTDVADGDFQGVLHWTNSGATPYNIFDSIFDYAEAGPIGSSASGDFGRFQSPAATAALSTYATASTDAARATALNTLENLEITQMPFIPIMAANAGGEYSTKNWSGWPSAANPYAPAQPTLINSLQIILDLKPASSS
jgi:peptide/nickel transport system substrate-binding protein